MIPIFDYSFFSLTEIQRLLRSKTERASALLLYTFDHPEWESMFADNPNLWRYLHDQAGNLLDIYIPYIPNSHYINNHSSQLNRVLQPSNERIKSYLRQLGIEDVDYYLKNHSDWMSFLFPRKELLYEGSRIVKQFINCLTTPSPILLIWPNYQSRSIIKITLQEDHLQLEKYFKLLISAFRTSSKTLLQRPGSFTIEKLSQELNNQIKSKRSQFLRKQEITTPDLEIISLQLPVRKMLFEVGSSYGTKFEDSIINWGHLVAGMERRASVDLKFKIVRLLLDCGFKFVRPGNKHEIWKHPNLNKLTTIPRHNTLSPPTIKSIMKDIIMAKMTG